jgi:hypothetical protein
MSGFTNISESQDYCPMDIVVEDTPLFDRSQPKGVLSKLSRLEKTSKNSTEQNIYSANINGNYEGLGKNASKMPNYSGMSLEELKVLF